jgi:hypothetical protein
MSWWIVETTDAGLDIPSGFPFGVALVRKSKADRLQEALREMVRQHPCHHPEGSQRQFCACCVARDALGDTPDE